MSLEEYLRTRLVELAVHADDLAVSAGRAVADLPEQAWVVAAEVLGGVAALRSGGVLTVRALARAERQPDAVRAL
jgi:hypothetical protein